MIKKSFGFSLHWFKCKFVPHEHNNYKPHIFHPYRLFFYATTMVFIKIIVVLVLLILPVSAFLTPDVLTAESNKIIELTNEIRKKNGVNQLKNSNLLSQAAFKKSQDMMIHQYFAHMSPENKNMLDWLKDINYQYALAGENLAIGFSSAQEVIDGWKKSITHYNNLIDPEFKEIGVSMVSGMHQENDTTIVTQFLATPAIGQQTKNNNLEIGINELQGSVSNEGLRTIKTNEVNEDIIEFIAPQILNTENDLVINQKEITFEIYAPLAQKVYILIDEKLESLVDDIESNYVIETLNLNEGQQIIEIVAVKGIEVKESVPYLITVDLKVPEIDKDKTKVLISKPVGQKQALIDVETSLSEDTVVARFNYNDYEINLDKSSENPNVWTGQLIINDYDDSDVFDPVILPSITAHDNAGNYLITDIKWSELLTVQPSLLKHYIFLKNTNSQGVRMLLDVSNIYYEILLFVMIFALLINVFVEIRKQHPNIIASALGLICLLIVLIVI